MLSRLLYVGKAVAVAGRARGSNLHAYSNRSFLTVKSKPAQFPNSLGMARAFSSYPEHKVLDLPNLSPTMTKGYITKWYKKEGDPVTAGDVICDVETDKATVGYEMVEDGVIAKILMPEGSKEVPLGKPVAIMVTEAKDVAAFKDYKPEAAAKPAAKKEEAPKRETKSREEAPRESKRSEGRVRAAPAAKKFAEENNIDLSEVTGSGPGGRILKEDIIAFMESQTKEKPKAESKPEATSEPKKSKPPVNIPGMPEFTDIELTNYKRVTAERLTEAKQTVPLFYVSVECEVDKLLTLRSQLNKIASTKISINDMLIKACSLACLKVPVTNSSWMGDFVRRYKDVDMSVAVQTPNGLITPIVPRANLKGFEQIAKITKELIAKAKDGTLKPEQFIGGTFTISNAGMYGISQLIPIVNPPQACILGVSAVEKKVVVDEAKNEHMPAPLRIASKMTVSLSCDHRVVDGAGGAEWTQEFKKLIENPALMML
uniref:Acetyltransferase component of pyruvate dehydrogenase complex n=1 Tax=Nyctotherus ovalis TaxID=70075 RepID=Q1EGH5_NYCOV|nr:pyruvate dehydrogenase E2 subunit [Nyctotherus ovalis]